MPAPTEQLRLFGMEDEPEETPDPVADEKIRLLRDDLGRGSGFVNGKLRIAEYFEQHQPTDKELAAFLQKEYGIAGHSGPDMPDVEYSGKGIHIVSADKKGNYHYTWTQAAKELRGMIERGEYITPQDVYDAVDHALYYLQNVAHLDDRERDWYTDDLKKLRSHPLLSDAGKARIDKYFSPEKAAELSPAAKYIMNEDNMPMFVDKLVAGDEMDEIAHRILDEDEDAASVAMDFIDESRYIISDHETFEAATFAVKKDTEGVAFTVEPDSPHPFSVSYSWEQMGEFFRAAAQLMRDVDREAEAVWEREAAEDMDANVQPRSADTYELYQMKSGEQYRYNRYESLESNADAHLSAADYDLVYTGDWSEIPGDSTAQKLDMLFQKFNVDHPADYRGRSMSTSDVVVVTENGSKTAYYIQPTGDAGISCAGAQFRAGSA